MTNIDKKNPQHNTWGDSWNEAAKAYREEREKQERLSGKPVETQPELPEGINLDDFYSYMPQHSYLFIPTGQLWPAASINGRLPWIGKIKPSSWLDTHRAIEQMTWAPGEPDLIRDKVINDGGWKEKPGAKVHNLYRPPQLPPGNPANAQPWIRHVSNIYPDDALHLIKWFAFRCQHPEIKINHALVLGGSQGVGKDTLLEPVRHAVGYWNCATVSPSQLVSRFNSFLKSILLVVPEARDLGEVNRPNFYEHTKTMAASPPEVLLVDEKHTQHYYIPNVTGLIITTNHKTAGIYLPGEDRRHYIAWSPRDMAEFPADYWNTIWSFYENGGIADVAAFLMNLKLSSFNPKEPPPRTPAFYEIVISSQNIEAGELEGVLTTMGWPEAVTLERVCGAVGDDGGENSFSRHLRDRKNRRLIPRWMEACGYVIVRNDNNKQGLFMVQGKRQAIYARSNITAAARLVAARALDDGDT